MEKSIDKVILDVEANSPAFLLILLLFIGNRNVLRSYFSKNEAKNDTFLETLLRTEKKLNFKQCSSIKTFPSI